MAFRFQKRIKVLPGVKLNLSKTGVSTSVGAPGATVNLRKGKAKLTVGAPGTGVSYSVQSKGDGDVPQKSQAEPVAGGSVVGAFFVGLARGLGPLGVLAVTLIALFVFTRLLFG